MTTTDGRLLEIFGEQYLLHVDEARREGRQVGGVVERWIEVPVAGGRVIDVAPAAEGAAGPTPAAVHVLGRSQRHERSLVVERSAAAPVLVEARVVLEAAVVGGDAAVQRGRVDAAEERG